MSDPIVEGIAVERKRRLIISVCLFGSTNRLQRNLPRGDFNHLVAAYSYVSAFDHFYDSDKENGGANLKVPYSDAEHEDAEADEERDLEKEEAKREGLR